LAIRVSVKDPAKAKTEGEAAIAGGIFASNADNALARVNANSLNAFNQITEWNEFRMSSTMESVLNGYADPRRVEYFAPVTPAGDAAYVGLTRGMRNGVNDFTLPQNLNRNVSNVAGRWLRANMATNSRIVLTYAEACFLMAEARLRGWAGTGTPDAWYGMGITASMNQFGITNAAAINAYITNSTNLPTTPTDCPRPVGTLPVAWAAAGTMADQMEQIMTQKWLATFPDGFEAWANFRRTGFPKFYPNVFIDPSSAVTAGNFIQRLPYTDRMKQLNATGVQAAETRMGGARDNIRLWFAGGN
jgi:hypothetical protein